MRRVVFEANEQGTLEDFNNLGAFPEAALDAIGEGLLIPDYAYWGFDAAAAGSTSVTVSGGCIIYDGKVYVNDDQGGTEFSLLARLPVATQKYVSIVAWGAEVDESTEARAFLTDVETRAIEARVIPTANLRRAELAVVSGTEEPDPSPPATASNQISLCDILLDTGGIVSITMNTENLAPNLRSLYLMAKAFDVWRLKIGVLIDTLASDLANLSGRIKGLADRSLVIGVMQDLAQVKDRVDLPDDYSAWAADHFLDYAESDFEHADWLALVEDGCRFPFAQQRDAQLGLLNSLDPKVTVQNELMLPAHSLVERVSITGRDGEISVSSLEYQTVTTVKKSIARQRIRYGTSFIRCTNSTWWAEGRYDPATNTFARAGEAYTVLEGDPRNNNNLLRLSQFWVDRWLEYYWENVVSTTQYSGSVLGQTFLNSQEGWLCAVDLYFSRKAATGDVQVLICETTDSGQPNLSAVIGSATLAAADIKLYPTNTRVPLQPTALQMGKRYGVVLVTGGNHYMAMVTGNKFSSGSMFTSTDGAWFQGDILNDMSLRLVFARFESPRVEVQMQPLQLENGIANIDINVDAVVPLAEGFGLIHEIQDPITGDWVPLDGSSPNHLIGLPAMLPYRIVFLGTTEMMPGIGVGSNSRLYTWRPRDDFTHISEDRVMPGVSTINTVYLTLRLEGWRGELSPSGHHTCIPKLMYDSGFSLLKTATAITDEVCQDDPDNAIYRRAVFEFNPAISEYKIQIEGTTDNVVTCFHVAERVDVALTITP